jgi:hypothetical protein
MLVYIAICNDRILDVYEDPVRAHDRLADEREHYTRHNGEAATWECLVPFDINDDRRGAQIERWHTPNGSIARLSIYAYEVCSWVTRWPL